MVSIYVDYLLSEDTYDNQHCNVSVYDERIYDSAFAPISQQKSGKKKLALWELKQS